MTVRAKFTVETKEPWNGGSRIVMRPVYSETGENATFFYYTPAGHIDLSTVNPAAADQFEVGKEYYVDFTLATCE